MPELTGKKLGIAVAKEVMRWTEWSRDADEARPRGTVFMVTKGDYLLVFDGDQSARYRYRASWRDKNDCWEVVEEIAGRRFSIRHKFISHLREAVPCRDGYRVDFDWWLFFCAEGSLNKHILRAALKAVEE